MKINILFSPTGQQAVDLLYSACRQCYYPGYVGDKYPFEEIPLEDKKKLLKHVISSGHHSVLEHVNFTFGIGEISRTCAQQITRHRIASFSMSSMRYCNVSDVDVHLPYDIMMDKDACYDFLNITQSAINFYDKYTKRDKKPIHKEDAREILPLGWFTHLVMTMNCRELLHFFQERLCTNAQEEIRLVAKEMLKQCNDILPEVFNYAGPKCKILGYCNEGKRTCGRTPLKEEIFHIYNINKKKD